MFSVNFPSKAVIIISIFIGVISHSLDFLFSGFSPYKFAPSYIRFYWYSLLFIDIALILVLLRNFNLGLFLCLILMISNVWINYLAYSYENIITSPEPLLFQTLFFGIVIGIALNGYRKNFGLPRQDHKQSS